VMLTNRDSNAGNLDQNEGGYHYPIGHGIMDCPISPLRPKLV
jgi:hypothetical protein